MKILLLSAYDAASHRYWRDGLIAAFPGWEWTVLSLPPRHFSWRVRGNPLSWQAWQREELSAGYDLVIATSMTDLATLRGLAPKLANTPAILYFHENQFAYPDQDPYRLLESQMVSIYSALAATTCLFNSDYNRSTFLGGVQTLLDRMPDKKPKDVHEVLGERSQVLPVPLTRLNNPVSSRSPDPGRPVLLWNHRWEHDKGPDILLHALRAMTAMGRNFKLILCGQRFRDIPPTMAAARREFGDHIRHDGYQEQEAGYYQLLRSADFVLSTALHEFQGLAVMQAVQRGCIPLVPDRLCYPEFFSNIYRYNSAEGDPAIEGYRLATRLCEMLDAGPPEPPGLGKLEWGELAPRYKEIIAATAARKD